MSSTVTYGKMSPQEKRALLEKLLREKAGQSRAEQADTQLPLGRSPQAERNSIQILDRAQKYFPLTSAQQRLWFLDQLDPGNPVYNISIVIRLRGELNVSMLAQSLAKIIERHEILRVNFITRDGKPFQFLVLDRTLELSVIDLSDKAAASRLNEAEECADQEAQRSFDLTHDMLVRANLFRLADDDHVFQFIVHHIVFDGWSFNLLLRDLTYFYMAESKQQEAYLPPLPIQYVDFAAWEASQLKLGSLDSHLDYWKNQLGGDLPILEMPLDTPRPDIKSFRAGKELLELPPSLTQKLHTLSRQEGVTLFVTLLSAFYVLMARYTGQEDIIVGTPVVSRVREETENLIGVFINNLALRTDLSSNVSFGELLKRTRRTTLDAFAHQHIPFERLLSELRVERDSSHSPVFQVYFNLLDVRKHLDLRLPNLNGDLLSLPEMGSIFDLTLYIQNWGDTLKLKLVYNSDIFQSQTMAEFLQRYYHFLEEVTTDPGQAIFFLPLPNQAKQRQANILGNLKRLHNEFTTFAAEEIDQSIPRRFEQQVAKYPLHIAVKTPMYEWTYEHLNRIANYVAHGILKYCDPSYQKVALLLSHDAPMIAGLLGALKAGKTYIPLDPNYPAERLRYMLEDAQSGVIITSTAQMELAKELTGGSRGLINIDELNIEDFVENPKIEIAPDELAYILYTSGSTGQPKGVMQNHRNVLHFIKVYINNLGIGAQDRLSLLSSYSFDAAVMDIFGALLTGATLYPIDLKEEGLSNLARYLNESQISIYHSTPTVYRYFVNALGNTDEFPFLRLIVLGGEPVIKRDVDLYKLRFSEDCVFINGLGPTESTVTLQYFIDKQTQISGHAVPLGYSVDETEIILLDKEGQETGLTGEIAIRSPYIALGYWQKPELTQSAFSTDPQHNGKRLYRTGDMGRLLPDGMIEFRGRKDFQVKIRGHRVEIGEVESILGQHPDVLEAVVVAHPDRYGEKRLIAYLVPNPNQYPSAHDLRGFLQRRLPDYMVPTFFTMLDALPLNASGKIDRRALPEPDVNTLSRDNTFVAPQTQLQELLASIFADVLGLEKVSINDSFFELGGHSLLATQVMSRLRRLLQIELPLRLLFEFPVVESMATAIESLQQEVMVDIPPLKPYERVTPPRLSFSQERMWFIHQLAPESAAYNIPSCVRIQGELKVDILEQVFNIIIARHEVLRTTFDIIDGGPVQLIAPAKSISLPVIDLQSLNRDEQENKTREIITAAAKEPFDLVTGPVLRTFLIKLGEDNHILFFAMHHIASDQWSGGIFMQEFAAIYNALSINAPIPLADLPIQYADYSLWQRDWLKGDILEAELAFWKKQLEGISVLDLPTDFPRPTVQTYNGSIERRPLSASVIEAVRSLCREEQITPFMFFLGIFNILLLRYTGQQDIAVGSPIANRNWLEAERLIGTFVNTVVLRTQLTDNPTFKEFLQRIRNLSLDAFNHQDFPFEKLIEELQPKRDVSYSPLVQVMFNVQNAPASMPRLHNNLLLTPVWLDPGAAQFDITLSVSTDIFPRMVLTYNTDLFNRDTMIRMLGHLEGLIHSALADPCQKVVDLPMLPQEEREKQLITWNDTRLDYPQSLCIHQLVEAQARKTPDAVAILFEDQPVTYRELNERANQLARHLQTLGVEPETPVGISAERSAELVIGLLGILKSGGTYIPLDPLFPQDRLEYMLENSETRVLLTQKPIRSQAGKDNGLQIVSLDSDRDSISQYSIENLTVNTQPQNLAYTIFTSGSTGKPKGVQIPHQAVVNFLTSMQRKPGLNSADRLLSVTTLSFDISVLEVFLPLTTGACVVIVPGEAIYDGAALIQHLSTKNITVMQATPATWQMLIDAGWQGDQNLKVLCGGEAMPKDLAKWLTEHVGSVWNMYGPTETTVWSTVCEITRETETITIGRPIANTQVYILDQSLEPTSIGVAGELYIAGDGVARGYLRQPELTAERFLPDPFRNQPGSLMYKTGDQARYLADGQIDFLGRADFQVKVRGFRIELGEIESILNSHPKIRQAVVIAREDTPGDKRLVAYLISETDRQPETAELRQFIRLKLPEYMVPSSFVFLDEFPMTPNRKVNRTLLPAPVTAPPQTERDLVLPRTPTEEKIAEIWCSVLGVEKLDVHDNFFDLGGHSLLATRVISFIREQFQIDLPLRILFMTPTIAEVSDAIDTILWAARQNSNSQMQSTGNKDEMEI